MNSNDNNEDARSALTVIKNTIFSADMVGVIGLMGIVDHYSVNGVFHDVPIDVFIILLAIWFICTVRRVIITRRLYLKSKNEDF